MLYSCIGKIMFIDRHYFQYCMYCLTWYFCVILFYTNKHNSQLAGHLKHHDKSMTFMMAGKLALWRKKNWPGAPCDPGRQESLFFLPSYNVYFEFQCKTYLQSRLSTGFALMGISKVDFTDFQSRLSVQHLPK